LSMAVRISCTVLMRPEYGEMFWRQDAVSKFRARRTPFWPG
jgi:hypothetical protein